MTSRASVWTRPLQQDNPAASTHTASPGSRAAGVRLIHHLRALMHPHFTMIRKFSLALFITALHVTGLQAAPGSGSTLTLEQLVQQALKSNPEIRFYETEIAATQGEARQAGTLQNPELATTFGHKTIRERDGTKSGDGPVWSASVSQTFEWPGRIGLRKAIANGQVQLARTGLEQFRSALASEVRSAGYRVHAARSKAEALKEVADRFQDVLQVLLQRDPAGPAPLLETRIIEASTISLRRQASDARSAMKEALIELNLLRGAAPSDPLELAVEKFEFGPLPKLEQLIALARLQNYDLRQRQAELAQQGLKLDLARNERWPSITVSPFIDGENPSDKEVSAGIGFSIPLPLWNRNKGNIQAAEARRQQAEASVLVTLREIEKQLATHHAAYESHLEEMQSWRADAAEQLRQAAQLADKHYRLGAVPVSTYLEMQKQYLEALDALLSTQADALSERQQIDLLTGAILNQQREAAE